MTPRTTLVSLLAAGALVGTLAAPAAQATGTPFVPPPPPGEPVSDTGFQPVEPLTDDSFSGRACGTRITITDVPELFGVKERVREYADGTLYVQGRGRDIVLATAADGRSARLDASGPYTLIITPLPGGGEEVDVYLRGATLLLPTNRTEARALRAAGLPRFSVFTGRVQLRDVTDAEGDQTSEVVSRPRFVTNACHLLQQPPQRGTRARGATATSRRAGAAQAACPAARHRPADQALDVRVRGGGRPARGAAGRRGPDCVRVVQTSG